MSSTKCADSDECSHIIGNFDVSNRPQYCFDRQVNQRILMVSPVDRCFHMQLLDSL